jgi:hypothetical protein
VNASLLFPKPAGYIPDTFLEVRNWIDYESLPELAAQLKDMPLLEHPGLEQALRSLEAQRKRDLEDWMDEQQLDCVVFPANGDVGFADLEFNLESARHSLQNGIKYSNGNRAIRHLGVPTVSVPMGLMPTRKMPVNLTFIGKAYEDEKLLRFAYCYEQGSQRRTIPPLTMPLESDTIPRTPTPMENSTGPKLDFTASIDVQSDSETVSIDLSARFLEDSLLERDVEVWVNGVYQARTRVAEEKTWSMSCKYKYSDNVCLGWDLKPLPRKPVMVLVIARANFAPTFAKMLWA